MTHRPEPYTGVVVQLRNAGESDRVVELLTVEEGRLALYARGARASRKRFAGVLDDGRRIVDVVDAIGVGEGTLGNWVRLERIERGERAGLTRDDRAELVELRKENGRLRMERDLLKRATAVWVKESGQ